MNRNEKRNWVIRILVDAAITIGVVLLLFRVLFNVVIIDGNSMLPTLRDGSIIFTKCQFYDLERGDIVVCDTDGYKGHIVKRVIAMEGDVLDIDFESGDVTVNGEVLDEPYIREETHQNLGTEFPLVVDDGCIFVLGDNRNNSLDSRSPNIGQIHVDDVRGKYLLSIAW